MVDTDPLHAMRAVHAALERSVALVAPRVWRGDEVTIDSVPPVGQAVLLLGRTSRQW